MIIINLPQAFLLLIILIGTIQNNISTQRNRTYLKANSNFFKISTLRDELFSLFPEYESPISRNEITDIIILWSASRSGSSFIYNLFASHPDILSLQGEDSTFYRLGNFHTLTSLNDSDQLIPNAQVNYDIITKNILRDAGYRNHKKLPIENTAFNKIQRILLQNPENNFSREELVNLIKNNSSFESILEILKIDNQFYENNLIKNSSLAPNAQDLIEETPFIYPHFSAKEKRRRNILILKSSSNLHRPDYVFKLFPSANYHHLILRRSPEGSINGLYDGWKSSGFHSHNVSQLTSLNIDGYQNNSWWKFDLPPRWHEFTQKKLEEVCAFQWKSATSQLIQIANDVEAFYLDYELCFQSEKLIEKINQFLKKIKLTPFTEKPILPFIMSTEPPNLNRWMEKEQLISSVVLTEKLRESYAEIKSFT